VVKTQQQLEQKVNISRLAEFANPQLLEQTPMEPSLTLNHTAFLSPFIFCPLSLPFAPSIYRSSSVHEEQAKQVMRHINARSR